MMRKALLALLLVLFLCPTVFADKWVRTGVLDPGQYIQCVVFSGIPVKCELTPVDGTLEETQMIVDLLNANPMTIFEPWQEYIWYRWDSGYWIKYKLPWKFIEGTDM